MIEEFLSFEGPAFLEVIIDPDAGVYPMVGPGLGYDAMITGDFIAARSRAAPRERSIRPGCFSRDADDAARARLPLRSPE